MHSYINFYFTFSIIKINFLNGVKETLQGTEKLIQKCHPKIIITVGFDEWGLIDIPQIIKEQQLNLTEPND